MNVTCVGSLHSPIVTSWTVPKTDSACYLSAMDASDPKKLRTYLTERLPTALVDELMEHLESRDRQLDEAPDPEEGLNSSLNAPESSDSQATESHTQDFAGRSHIGRLPTLSHAVGGPLDLMLPVARGPADDRANLLSPGTKVKHFHVNRLLGRGGMGEVYLARDTQLGRKVALKVIKPDFVKDRAALLRFLQEARVTARFNHPHIVTIYAVGEHEGLPYVALEYLEGQDLSNRIRDEGLSLQESLRICLAVAEAVTEAHRHGILHRDLKPANVLIPRDGRVRVVDFGLALEFAPPEDTEAGETRAQQEESAPSPRVIGTPAYMAPEQWRGEECQPATDVWALGMILHELVCGERPYPKGPHLQLGFQVCSSDPVPLNPALNGLPARLSTLIEQCLAKSPEARPPITTFTEVISATLADGRRVAPVEESPFRGLLPFSERHASLFFGRDPELNTCMERLRYETSLVVVGPSGAGKTSFVQAGLIPRLRENSDWRVVRMRPGDAPITRLATRILTAHSEESASHSIGDTVNDQSFTGSTDLTDIDSRQIEIESLASKLKQSPNKLGLGLRTLANQTQQRVLLVIDQLEELFTLCPDPKERALFIEAIGNAGDEASDPVRVVCTIRDDFLGHLARAGEAARRLLEHIMLLEPPNKEALKDVLTLPLLRVGYRFDDADLPDEMVNSVDDATSLPLLQFVARSLWDKRDQVHHVLRRADYEGMGGVEGALARHADGVLHGLAQDQMRTARALLLRLVTPDGTRRVCSESQLLDGLPADARMVYQRLTKSRLLSMRRSGESDDGSARLELAHESLIHTWDKLARWIDESKEELIILAEVNQAAELWEKRGRRPEELWTGSGLEEASRIIGRGQNQLTGLTEEFLNAGQALHEVRRRRRRFWATAIPMILITVTAVLALQKFDAEESREQSERGRQQALHQRRTAETQRRQAQFRQVEALRESAQAAFERGAFLEARAKIRKGMELAGAQYHPFLGLWWQLDRIAQRWVIPTGQFHYHVTFSRDGQQIAVSSMNGSVELISTHTGRRRLLRGHQDQVVRSAFHPDGHLLASGGLGPFVRLWDVKSGQEIEALPAPRGMVRIIKYSQDGRYLAVSGGRQWVRVWDMTNTTFKEYKLPDNMKVYDFVGTQESDFKIIASLDGDMVRTQLSDLNDVQAFGVPLAVLDIARISGDGRMLLHRDRPNSVALWELSSMQQIGRYSGRVGRSHAFGVDHESAYFAIEQPDGNIQIYDLRTQTLKGTVPPSVDTIGYLALSPGGGLIADTGSNYIRLSRADLPPPPVQTMDAAPPVYSLALNSSGSHIAISTTDDEIRIWNLGTGRVDEGFSVKKGGKVDSVQFSPDDQYLAWLTKESDLTLWDLEKNQVEQVIPGVIGEPMGLRFDRLGRQIIAITSTGMWLFDALSKTLKHEHKWSEEIEPTIALSKDGKRAVIGIGSMDTTSGTVEHWDVQNWRQLRIVGQAQSLVSGVAYDPEGRWVASGTFDGKLKLWQTDSTVSETLLSLDSRINALASHPSGDRFALALADGRSLLKWVDGDKEIFLDGHIKEVNRVAFSANGRVLASAGDDGTLRVWDADTGRALWKTVALLPDPVRLLNHEGWRSLRPGQVTIEASPGRLWSENLETRARLSSTSGENGLLCVSTYDDHVEIWDTVTDKMKWSTQAANVSQVLATPSGCLVLTIQSNLTYYTIDGGTKPYSDYKTVHAMAVFKSGFLIAADSQVYRFDSEQRQVGAYEFSPGISAIAFANSATQATPYLMVGFEDGSIETLNLDEDSLERRASSIHGASAAVSRLMPLPGGLMTIGYGNGQVVLWDVMSQKALNMTQLHGAIQHIHTDGEAVYVATDLGQAFAWDLTGFNYDRCDLMKQVWTQVPVTWNLGHALETEVPRTHPCAVE